MTRFFVSSLVALCMASGLRAERLVGLDRLARFDQLPVLLEGTQALQVSSRDRRGGNDGDGYFGTHAFLYADANGEKVLYDEQGPGCLYRFWMTFTNPSVTTNQLRFYFDHETEPRLEITVGEFFGGARSPFLFPLVGDGTHSCKGYYSYYPFPYVQGLKVTIDSVPTGAGDSASPFYYNMTFHRFDSSEGVQTWTGSEEIAAVMDQLSHVGTDPKNADSNTSATGTATVASGSSETVFSMNSGAVVQSIRFNPEPLSPAELRNTFLVMNWDGGDVEVEVPLGCFFGSGTNELEVLSLPIGMSAAHGYYCYFPMPFWESAEIVLSNAGPNAVAIPFEIQHATNSYARSRCGYFCVEHRAQYVVSDGDDVVFADATGRGHFVGLSLFIRGDDFTGNNLDHLEGDERIYIDGSASPAIYGTGTEDYFNCAWYFANAPALLPYHGVALQEFHPQPPNCTQAYRFYVGDALPFRSSFLFGMEHGRANNTCGWYDSVAYLYKQAAVGMEKTAEFEVVDGVCGYAATGGVVSVTNHWRYEGDDDQTYHSATGFAFSGSSSFEVPTDTNAGMVLRRLTDRGIGRQKADVYVDGTWAGAWYDADCNFTTQRLYNTTNHVPVEQRWCESDFLVSQTLTAGKTNLHIQVVRDGSGADAWNEYRYQVFRVLPLDSPFDVDRDGLPDSWEVAYFNNIGAADPAVDADGDGFPTLDEHIANTSPIDALSFFRLERMPDRGFAYFAHAGRTYELLESTNLVLGGWQSLGVVAGDDAYHYLEWNGTHAFHSVNVRKPD